MAAIRERASEITGAGAKTVRHPLTEAGNTVWFLLGITVPRSLGKDLLLPKVGEPKGQSSRTNWQVVNLFCRRSHFERESSSGISWAVIRR